MSDEKEIVLSTTFPGDWLRTAIRTSLDRIGILLFRTLSEPMASLRRGTALASNLNGNGCVFNRMDTIAHETILGYDTVMIQLRSGNERVTIWRAPRLSCFPLRLKIEEPQKDGWRLRFERTAVRVRQYD
jgi:hypothetical protein